ncbi:hypothetical protein COCNU_02G016120 [Cocos nucifera]|uniref:Uncharacterized protein n=1 Tax=Cocos nucifera TaxID=13894 RepID=A0A8K0I0M4_COCNU|nr:hypothetical protein COCNU_02G016120 [Cocos nucifera]
MVFSLLVIAMPLHYKFKSPIVVLKPSSWGSFLGVQVGYDLKWQVLRRASCGHVYLGDGASLGVVIVAIFAKCPDIIMATFIKVIMKYLKVIMATFIKVLKDHRGYLHQAMFAKVTKCPEVIMAIFIKVTKCPKVIMIVSIEVVECPIVIMVTSIKVMKCPKVIMATFIKVMKYPKVLWLHLLR